MQVGRLILLLSFLQISPAFGQLKSGRTSIESLQDRTFTAKVIRILDGDTMEVLYQNNPIKIRLAHIDSPEKKGSQPYGNRAKQALSDLCFGQQVTVHGEKSDRYGRLIAIAENSRKQIINQEMVKQGMAWHFKKYSADPIYANLEQVARKNKVGLWGDINPVAPWSWRRSKHAKH